MTGDAPDIYRAALRAFRGEALRSRETLVPSAFAELWERVRFSVWYGGRGAAKSWSIARILLVLASEQPLRVLCCREIQGSIRESAYRLLADQITLLELDDFYEVQADRIIGRNGTVFYFEGLRYNSSKIRSYEGVDVVWIEEAQSVSEMSWETLFPTIRKAGSRFYISFNPMTRSDPVLKRFVDNAPPGAIVRKVSYRDNPHLSPEAESERVWLERTDPDAYRHVWEGFPREVSDALILRGKYEVGEFDVSTSWAGPYHGLDYGFSRDPSAALRCYIDDESRTLYVSHEFWALGCDIDALPGALEAAIPGVSRHVVYADASRPESTSYLARNGVPSARSAEKWPGSVDDGIAYLRSFSRIVIAPGCKHLLDECGTYSFRTDRLTGVPLPEPEDSNNHLIDALRYALSPLIRNQPSGGHFSRAALLDRGEPVGAYDGRPSLAFATAALSDRPGGAVGFCYWVLSPHHGHYLVLLDYDLAEVDEACSAIGLSRVFARLSQLREEWRPLDGSAALYTEEGELYDALVPPVVELSEQLAAAELPFLRIESESLPAGSLDDRAAAVRTPVNSGTFVKFARAVYSRQATHRSVTANHLVSQVLGYRQGIDAPRELAAAFVLGCCVSYDRHRRPAVGAAAPPVPIAAPELERVDAPAAERAAALRREAFEREVAQWQAEYDAALAAARRRLGNPGWQPRCPQQIGVRPKPLVGFPLPVG